MKKNKKLTVSIGIPAYNEEKNIGRLLRELLRQKTNGFSIKQIIVISDASTDKTSQIVRRFKDRRVRMIEIKVRQGQSASQNALMQMCDEDILVILESDTLPASDDYLIHLLSPFFLDKDTKLIQGKALCAKPITFVSQVFEHQYEMLLAIYESDQRLRNKICSGRGGRAFAKSLYKTFQIPLCVPEDVFTLLWCQQRKMKVHYAEYAIMYFQPSGTFTDFVNAEKKVIGSRKSLEIYFGKKLVNKHYKKGIDNFLSYILTFAVLYPFHFLSYVLIKSVSYFLTINHEFSDFWSISSSTKVITAKKL